MGEACLCRCYNEMVLIGWLPQWYAVRMVSIGAYHNLGSCSSGPFASVRLSPHIKGQMSVGWEIHEGKCAL